MPRSDFRIILDTNVVLRGLLNTRSASGKLLEALDRRSAVVLLSKRVIAEYRAVLTHPAIVEKYPELTIEKVETALRRFRYLGEYFRAERVRFEYPRDPMDEMFIVLAIAGSGTDIVTGDNDLLSLPAGHTNAAKQFRQRLPRTRILQPSEFVAKYGREIGIIGY